MAIVFSAFVVLAVVRLIQGVAVLPSILWLAIYSFMAYGTYKSCRGFGGFVRWAICEWWGVRFIELCDAASDHPKLRVYSSWGPLCYTEDNIALEQIAEVSWYRGQASAISERDRDDWGVSLEWSQTPFEPLQRGVFDKNRGFCYIGTFGKKENAGRAGLALVAWLGEIGVQLVPAEEPHTYVRSR